MPKGILSVAEKFGRNNPKVDYDKLLYPVLEILYQHPWGIKIHKLFELLELKFKNGHFYKAGRPLYNGSGYRRVRTEVLTIL